ncbi:hypothetical protein NQ314_002998 [Rhamnusium bicolor]|uniref:Uncharacterized protein n=1 Tax=Rhamnusium bicolor TaxID=1586634 RepID=A0AAV8ZNM6_9CUCU|nr:hypothetical protein NQ314_002998 [Rhamnusium bicolor]
MTKVVALLILSPLTDSGEVKNLPSISQNNSLHILESNIQTSNQIINSKISLTSENQIMAQFKPEYLSCVPQFDGNPNELNRVLSTCDSVITAFYDATNPNNFHNVYLLNSLIGKLTGSAKVVVNIQSVTTWNELKDTLYRNFADQRDEACLNRDLVLLKQFPNEKPQQFFDRCLQILNLICSYVDIHEEQVEAKILKRDLYNKLTLKTFLSGLTEPMGKTIRCMRPTDMNQALQFIIQEENIQYYQNFTSKNFIKQAPVQNKPVNNFPRPVNNFPKPVNNFPRYPFNNHNQFPSFNSRTQNNQFRQQNNNFPSQPIQFQQRMNNPPQKFFRNSQVFKNPNQNVFKPNPNVVLPNPTPMSVVTRQTSNNFQQGPSTSTQYRSTQRNFTPEELYNAEVDEIDDSIPINDYGIQNVDESYDDTNQIYYEDETNFQQDASIQDQT